MGLIRCFRDVFNEDTLEDVVFDELEDSSSIDSDFEGNSTMSSDAEVEIVDTI